MFQRVNLILQAKQTTNLTYQYQYPLFCEISKKIALIDDTFGEKYHKEGLRNNKTQRNLKLLTMTLDFDNMKPEKDYIKIYNKNNIKLELSGDKRIINLILNGFLIDPFININNNIFEFKKFEIESKKNFKESHIYKIKHCVVESIKENNKVIFLDVYNPNFYKALIQNLKRKYELIYDKNYEDDIEVAIEDFSDIKPRSIKIKDGYVQGYRNFNIIIQAKKEIQEIAYYCGIGSHNSFGAGYLREAGGF